jgi:hypothetical protein
VVVRRSALKPFQVHEMKVNNKARQKNEMLKWQFSQMEGDLNLQEIFKSILIPKKKHNCDEKRNENGKKN